MSSLPTFTFGTLLRRYRLRAGLTQAALAEQASLSIEAISTLERGTRRAPRRETIELIAGALGLSPIERDRLYQAARGQAPPDIVVHHPPVARETLLPLIGRVQEMALLKRHLAGEGPPLLLLAGEPGIGKTRLLQEARQWANGTGWTVLEGGCHRRSGQEPYMPLLNALESALRAASQARLRTLLDGCAWLVRLLPELAETTLVPAPSWMLSPEQERRLMFAAVNRFLANGAGPMGTLLILDDLQWAGVDALDLLASLLHTPAERPLRMIGAYRSTEVRTSDPLAVLLADLAVAGMATQQALSPLATSEAREMLEALLQGAESLGSSLQKALLARTGGVPFFLVSCAQDVRAGMLEGRPPQDIPWKVTESIRQRVAALPEDAQELLNTAAVIGREAPTTLLIALASDPQADMLVSLKILGQAHLLVEEGEDTARFAHDLIREVVLANLGLAQRRSLHRQVAEALEKRGGAPSAEVLAYHYLRAGVTEKAAIYLEQAGDHAVALRAYAEAERDYREAVTLLEQEGYNLETARVQVSWGTTLRFLGRYEEAMNTLERAFETYQRVNNGEAMARAAVEISQVHLHRHTIPEGLVWLEPLIAALRQRDPSPDLARLYYCQAALYGTIGNYQQELEAIEQAKACAPAIYASSDEGGWWREEHAATLFMLGRLEEAAHLLEQFIGVTSEGARIEAFNTLAGIYLNLGDFERERQYIEQGLALAEYMDDQPAAIFARHRRGRNAFFRGDWVQAKIDLEESLRQSEELAAVRKARPGLFAIARPDFFHFGVGLLRLAEGQREAATRLLEEELARAAGQIIRPMSVRWTQMTLAERDVLEGHPGEAHARLEPLLDRADYPETDVTRFLPILAWAYLDLGEQPLAERTLQQALERTRRQQMRPALSDALRVQALLCISQQHWDEAQAALEEALAFCRAMPYPWAEAKALYVYGLLHTARDEPDWARERLEAALAILNRLGERLYAEQAERALAALPTASTASATPTPRPPIAPIS